MKLKEKREKLVQDLKEKGFIKTDKVIRSIKKVPRHLFLPEDLKNKAYMDNPLPIGHNQTISAPHMVGILLEELDIESDNKVLEIGGGSGYNAAVIAEILDKGKVYSIEKIPSLAKEAEKNLKKAGYSKKVKLITSDGSKGYKEKAPYDRILLTAGAPKIPPPLENQLKNGGIIVAPVGDKRRQELVVGKKEGKKIEYEKKGGCAFVPLKGKYGF